MTDPSDGLQESRPGLASPYLAQALALHHYLVRSHSNGAGLIGPDSGVRFNYRAGRLIKSYFSFVPWRDSYYYLQTQGYWTLANLRLGDLTGEPEMGELAAACCEGIQSRQAGDGSWAYPNPAWAGRVATAEGTWAALGLLAGYRRLRSTPLRESATAWHRFLEESVGYSACRIGSAVNYFADRSGPAVPNNSALVVRFLQELATAYVPVSTGRITSLLDFLRAAQRRNGELPYAIAPDGGSVTDHFQCFQYNAFQCLDLVDYHERSGDDDVLELIAGLARFLLTGVADDGHVFFDCRRGRRAVTYHAAAVGAALSQAARLGLIRPADEQTAVFEWVLAQQRSDGGVPFSLHDYRYLHDGRSYPRNLAMVLQHLLLVDSAPW